MSPSARRRVLTGAVASAAAVAGAGLAWWRLHPDAQPAAKDAADAANPSLWALEFATPDGGRLSMASLRGQPLVLNFWATWCPPCVREMPALDRFYRDHRAQGWQVLGLAADSKQPVREFLARTPVTFGVALAGFEGIELSRQLGNSSGGLPFTVLYGRDGQARKRHVGETSYEQLADWARGIS